MRIAQLGHGRWGQNLLRAFSAIDGVEVARVCDPRPEARANVPGAIATEPTADGAFASDVDAVVIATPAELHHEHARAALAAGKHVFVEKPLALEIGDASELVALAARGERTLMVGHVVLFDEAVRWIKRFLDAGGLGQVRRVSFRRSGDRRPGRTLSALWNLAPHDVSLADYWFGGAPSHVEGFGWSTRADGLDEESLVRLRYDDGPEIDIRVGWLEPQSGRRAVLVGSQSTVVYESAPETRLTVYRRSPVSPQIVEPQIVELARREPLRREAEHFIDCVRGGHPPLTDGESGLRVVSTLVAAAASRRARGSLPLAERALAVGAP